MNFVDGITTTTTTSGTSDFVISGIVPYSKGASGLVDQKVYRYFAYYSDLTTTGWERGWGVYTSSSTTLTRVVIESSASPNTTKESFTGASKTVEIVATSRMQQQWQRAFPDLNPEDCIVNVILGQSNGTGVAVQSPSGMTSTPDIEEWRRENTSPLLPYSFMEADPSYDSGYLSSPLPSSIVVGMMGNDFAHVGWSCAYYQNLWTGRKVFNVSVTLPGAALSEFLPTSPEGQVYTEAKVQIDAAMAVIHATYPNAKVNNVIWWQGETNKGDDPDEYATSWLTLRDAILADWGTEYVTNFLLCGLAPDKWYWEGLARIDQITDGYTRYISPEGLSSYDPIGHFDAPSIGEMGRRCALSSISGPTGGGVIANSITEYDPGADDASSSPEVVKRGFYRNITRALTNTLSTIEEWALNGTVKAKLYITGVMELSGLTLTGTDTDYTVKPGAIIEINGDHTYDWAETFGMVIPPVVNFAGTHTLKRGGNLLGQNFLFWNHPVVTNPGDASPQESWSNGPHYTTVSQITFRADNAVISQTLQYSHMVHNTVEGVNGGTYTITNDVGYLSNLNINAGGVVTNRTGFLVNNAIYGSPTGALTNQIGFMVAPLTAGTNNVEYLAGTLTPPTGDWGYYQASTKINRFNAPIATSLKRDSNGFLQLLWTDGITVLTNSSAQVVLLPDITDMDGKGTPAPDGTEIRIYQEESASPMPSMTLVAASTSPTQTIMGPTTTTELRRCLTCIVNNGNWITY